MGAAVVPDDQPVRFFLFGGVRIVRDGVEIAVQQPKQRAILTLLLATPGEPVSLSEMTDSLWIGEPAASVSNQIHRHVGALRRTCQPELQRRQVGRYIVAAGSGYRLIAGPENCDVVKFHEVATNAHRLARAGQREEALHAYLGSLEVAAAAACDDRLATLPALVGLEDERVRAMIGAAEQCQAADEFAAVLPILRAATGRHPLNEALHAHLMTALTRTGRPAEALEVYAAIRRTLEEELGSSPSAALEEAQAHALSGDDTTATAKGRSPCQPRHDGRAGAAPVTSSGVRRTPGSACGSPRRRPWIDLVPS